MLSRLSIRNYILIEELDIDFNSGLTVITGETGAGKSILLGALSLVLGQRADLQVILNKQKKCTVEGTFQLSSSMFLDFFHANDLDFDANTIIRREISPEGKSRAFINDTPVNVQQLKQLGAMLVDIHSQHETLTLNNSVFQLSVVDVVAGNGELLKEYSKLYSEYKKAKAHLDELIEQEKKSKADLDYFKFQFNELEEVKLIEGEQTELEQELNTLNNSENIKSSLSKALYALSEGESNLLNQLSEINSLVQPLTKFNNRFEQIAQRIKSSQIELKDIASEIEAADVEVNFSPSRIEEINNRLNSIYRLQQKHHVNDIASLIVIKNELEEKLLSISSIEDRIQKTGKELEVLRKNILDKAKAISNKRIKAIPEIERDLKKMFKDVGMPNAVLKIEQTVFDDDFNETGIDAVKFLFSANKGVDYKELNKVASGGELSRLMLCIKSLLASNTLLPTIIFDEIDTGVSGEVAYKVGALVERISKHHQVVTITHLPQMASRGEDHLFVYKEAGKNNTRTFIKKLNNKERINEIAKMLSGDSLTDAALENAKELLSK